MGHIAIIHADECRTGLMPLFYLLLLFLLNLIIHHLNNLKAAELNDFDMTLFFGWFILRLWAKNPW